MDMSSGSACTRMRVCVLLGGQPISGQAQIGQPRCYLLREPVRYVSDVPAVNEKPLRPAGAGMMARLANANPSLRFFRTALRGAGIVCHLSFRCSRQTGKVA